MGRFGMRSARRGGRSGCSELPLKMPFVDRMNRVLESMGDGGPRDNRSRADGEAGNQGDRRGDDPQDDWEFFER